jgi:hypothetical protein
MNAPVGDAVSEVPAERPPGWRLSHALTAVLMALTAAAGGAVAQPVTAGPAAPALPSVIYPDHDPDTSGPRGVPPATQSWPAPAADQGQPVQYYYVNGVWGFWDRYRRFHPVPGHGIARAPEHPHQAPRYANVLPNPAPRPIVAQHFTPPHRNPPR